MQQTSTAQVAAVPIIHCQIVNLAAHATCWRLLSRLSNSRFAKAAFDSRVRITVDKDRLRFFVANAKTAIQIEHPCINLDMQDDPQEIIAPAEVLHLLSTLPTDVRLKLETAQFWPHKPLNDQRLVDVHFCVRQGAAEFHFLTLNNTLPARPTPEPAHTRITMPTAVLREALQQVRQMVATETDVRNNVNCLLLDQFPDQLNIVGTDGHWMGVYRRETPDEKHPRARILIPRELFAQPDDSVLDDLLQGLSEITFTDLGPWLHIQVGDIEVWHLAAGYPRPADLPEFADYQRIYAECITQSETAVFSLNELSGALQHLLSAYMRTKLAPVYLQIELQSCHLKTSEEGILISQQTLDVRTTGALTACVDARKLQAFCRQFQASISANMQCDTFIELHIPLIRKHPLRLNLLDRKSSTDYFLMPVNGELDW